jgi:low affinity Fe/Cu permease
VASSLHLARAEDRMILTVVFVCLLLWLLGLMTSYTLGGVLHILLVVAIVLFLVHIIQGNSIGNA